MLCLTLQFDLSAVPDTAAQRAKDHGAACEAACVASGICAPSEAFARAETTHDASDPAAARALPFDNEGPARHVRLLFLYSAAAPQLCVRVVVALPHLDGVSGLRLALHTLEALEGTALCAGAAFKTNPSFKYTARHAARTLALAAGTGAAAAWAWLRSPVARPDDAAVPRTPAGLYAYYRAPAPPLALFCCFAPRGASPQEAYKQLLAAAQQWHDATGRRGFFNLINVAPHVMPSIVPRADDMRSMERRFDGVLLPPAPPPMGPAWIIANHVHIAALFVNNYGRHDHTFKAVPTVFLWDWLGMAAPIAGFGCVTINGVFLAWVRGTPADMDGCKATFAAALGEAVGEHQQIAWPQAADVATCPELTKTNEAGLLLERKVCETRN